MLKKLLIFFIALAPIAAVAQDVKIAYINAQEVFAAMPELSNIETQLSQKQEQINKNGQALIDEFNKKAEEFETSSCKFIRNCNTRSTKTVTIYSGEISTLLANSQQEMNQLSSSS